MRIVTKDKAYIAAGKCIEKFRGITGSANQKYLKANFDETWSNYDVKGKKKIEESEAYQLLKEIWIHCSKRLLYQNTCLASIMNHSKPSNLFKIEYK